MTEEQKQRYAAAYLKAVQTGDYSEVNAMARELVPDVKLPEWAKTHPSCPEVETPHERARRELGWPIKGQGR